VSRGYFITCKRPAQQTRGGSPGITEYTVQEHRGHIMRKMQADSFATLVRQASELQLETSSMTTLDA